MLIAISNETCGTEESHQYDDVTAELQTPSVVKNLVTYVVVSESGRTQSRKKHSAKLPAKILEFIDLKPFLGFALMCRT